MATGGASVGRTQSAGLRILGERELEIQNFVPEEYFTLEGILLSKDKEEVKVEIKKMYFFLGCRNNIWMAHHIVI